MTNHSSQSTDLTSLNIAVIGGGLTGLFTATLLERAFNQGQNQQSSCSPHITIFEKSRSVGRLATRYRTDSSTGKNWQWAFGAQFFTAKTASFQQFIKPWLKTGLLQPWCAQVVTISPVPEDENHNETLINIEHKEQWSTQQPRYISIPKMTAWGRVLADKLAHTTIKFQTRVAPLAQYTRPEVGKQTELFDDTGTSLGWFDWVICTAPNTQAVELIANSTFAQKVDITKPRMLACYTLMLGWDKEQPLPKALNNQPIAGWDVAYVKDSILDRVFIEHQKPSHHELLPSVTIHARNDWSEAHVDDDIDMVKAQLLEAAQQLLHWNQSNAPSQIDCHRWRYAATVIDAHDKDKHEGLGALIDRQHRWIVSGDWCGQGNIESCYQMAQEAVTAIVSY
ncbi:NAD(P)/FAD-dependent oxidoreductase [Psychrobacter alimentarius]|uniref:NAD(P)/FAD-dependent oxidoreductase n=1 Tax=Psychrobacter alimentarius TaxID=261164 RepID=UPI0019193804|nr:NAD(P)-binding protein [Psychrobacter alimentarius]